MSSKNVYVGIACLVFGLSIAGCSTASPKSTTEKAPAETVAVPVETETIKTTQEITSASETEAIESTYAHNAYYDVIENADLVNSVGDSILIDKMLAKKDVTVSGTLIAYDSDGKVIGKSTDRITLTAGQNNYFKYHFDGDVSNATIKATVQAEDDPYRVGARNAVEMVEYNQKDDHLYITFIQTKDGLSQFAGFKILFYKNDVIVDTFDGFLSTYTENLNGKDSTDVAKISTRGIDYDRFEYIFEP